MHAPKVETSNPGSGSAVENMARENEKSGEQCARS